MDQPSEIVNLRAALEARRDELKQEFERLAAPYRAALGEVERTLKLIEHDDEA